ncbi:hypothetical protein IHE51_02345 [Candidatus Parvarchaeota archaeon]|uniref:Uncharacterized protein n=1 Tax=Candidatus Acidifodinimicrobium mancum TaxID=2898728 RepID=A0A8T3UZ18_9ARCH|nr:hypothetical protein [Candidatus Acidifodinimicrobium mancum]
MKRVDILTGSSRTESASKGGSYDLPSVGDKSCQKVSSEMVVRTGSPWIYSWEDVTSRTPGTATNCLCPTSAHLE